MQEQEAIRRCQAGDLAALGVLYEMHRQAVFRAANRFTRHQEDAEDVTQDVFIELFTAIKRYDLKRPFLPWLNSIARHRSLDKVKRRKPFDVDIDLIIDHPSPDLSPEEEAEKSVQRAAIWAAVKTLDQKHRAVVVLYYYHGFSVAETAKVLGCLRVTVRRRMHTARGRLRGLVPPPDPVPTNPKFSSNGKEETKDLVQDTFVAGLC